MQFEYKGRNLQDEICTIEITLEQETCTVHILDRERVFYPMYLYKSRSYIHSDEFIFFQQQLTEKFLAQDFFDRCALHSENPIRYVFYFPQQTIFQLVGIDNEYEKMSFDALHNIQEKYVNKIS